MKKKRKTTSKKSTFKKSFFNKDTFDSYQDDDCLINVYFGKDSETNKEKRITRKIMK